MVNMLLNIKIAFLFFVLDIYMMNMGGLVFLMPDGYDVFFSMENNSYYTHQCFFL